MTVKFNIQIHVDIHIHNHIRMDINTNTRIHDNILDIKYTCYNLIYNRIRL